jgi:hypothetical protein
MNAFSIISIAAAFCIGVISGIKWQREKYRRGLKRLNKDLKNSTDTLESAVNSNQQNKKD